MRRRLIPIFGIAFIGDAQPETQQIIADMGRVRVLGRLPRLEPLTPDTLRRAFRESFDLSSFSEVIV